MLSGMIAQESGHIKLELITDSKECVIPMGITQTESASGHINVI